MFHAVIFDMDGVICHTNPWHSKAFKVFFEKRGLNPTEEEYRQHMYGKNNSYIFSHFLSRKIDDEELVQFENEKEGLFREIYANHVTAIDGYLDFLEWLVDNNFKVGVATSAPSANRDLILDKLGIADMFDSLMASEDVKDHKPHPEVYLTSADNLNVLTENCLVFEDSFSGVNAAKRAGMSVVGVLSSHTPKELPRCSYYTEAYDEELKNWFLDHS